ncbi:unnamed protein product [Sphacelaria rigidula]
MVGVRFSTTSAVITGASLLAYQTGAEAVSRGYLRKLANSYTEVGCFKDSKQDRILGHKLTDDENMNAQFCFDYCLSLGAPYFGTQFGVECWCATEMVVEYDRHGEGAECNYACAGNGSEMCGGNDALNLYSIESTDASSGLTIPSPSPVSETSTRYDHPTQNKHVDTLADAFSPDIVKIIDVVGANPRDSWADSYSVGSRCYMQSTFDHGIGTVEVDTPLGPRTIKELFDLLEPGPDSSGRPLYNGIRCGNGPANDAQDEIDCPGLVNHGRAGCGQIGPVWDLSELEP